MMLLNAGRCREFNNQHSKTLKSLKMIKIHDTIPQKYTGVHKRLKNEKKKKEKVMLCKYVHNYLLLCWTLSSANVGHFLSQKLLD